MRFCVAGMGYVGRQLYAALCGVAGLRSSAYDPYKAPYTDKTALDGCLFYFVCVPTGLDEDGRPNRKPLRDVFRSIGSAIVRNALTDGWQKPLIVNESTVYPGCTEEIAEEILTPMGLELGKDYDLAYSPERVNPGDQEHGFDSVVKIVAGHDEACLERVDALYRDICPAGTHRAPSIATAELAKVFENTQREVNIALMNLLPDLADAAGTTSKAVQEAMATKWNALGFRPGLVGGHCIGVDSEWLTTWANEMGRDTDLIRSAQDVGITSPSMVMLRIVDAFNATGGFRYAPKRVLVLGATYKANVADTRNSKVPEVVESLEDWYPETEFCLYDPLVPDLAKMPEGEFDAKILMVPHDELLQYADECVFDVRDL